MTNASIRRVLIGIVPVLAATGLAIVPAPAEAHRPRGPVCFPLRGSIEVTLTDRNCDSPVGLCTEGRIRTSFGLFSGSTRFVARGLGGEPVGEASIVTPPVEPATTWSYTGTLTIRTHVGTVVFSDVGVLDTVSGTFTEINRPVSGTGTFRGVTGTVFMSGFVTPDGSGFEGAVSGELCVPRN